MATAVFTIGHSTRDWDAFGRILASAAVTCLLDVRRFPGSRRYPHFGKDNLAVALPREGLTYVHEQSLGGRRRPSKTSINTFWTHPMFRGYADHMSTAEFQAGVDRVMALAEREVVAVMCAEAHPSRCHRRLLADALRLRGATVVHLLEAHRHQTHESPPQMRACANVIPIYPGEEAAQTDLFGSMDLLGG